MVTNCGDRSRPSTRKYFRSSKRRLKIKRPAEQRGLCRVCNYAARVPLPRTRGYVSQRTGRDPAPGSLFLVGRAPAVAHHGTFVEPFRLMSMSERATTKLIGLSISGLFLMMLMLNAISS